MKIRLADYKEGVCTRVEEDYDPKALEIEFVDLKYSRPLHLDGTIEKDPDSLTFRGHLTSHMQQTCGRCLRTSEQPLDEPFEFFYEIKGQEEIDTTDDLREILILDHPLSFLCQEQCRGLCPSCGINWNEAQCRCPREETHASNNSFTVLKEIWTKRKKEN